MSFAAGGGILGALGSILQGEGAATAAEYNATIARQNAAIAAQQGEAAAQAQGRNAERHIGSMVAAYGASGVEGSSGSAMDVLADSARMSTLDNLTLKYNYALKGLGYENAAKLDDTNAAYSRTAGLLGAAGAGASNYSKYAGWGSESTPINGTPIPGQQYMERGDS